MKFNPDREHGTITGHAVARFEQNGVLFDGGGNALVEEKEPAAKPDGKVSKAKQASLDNAESLKIANAREFLERLLDSGPRSKSVVFREAEKASQEWETVTNTFLQMGGVMVQAGAETQWRLPAPEDR